MKKNQLTWAKTIIIAYKYLGVLCKCIDKIINSTATNSVYYGGSWDDKYSVYNVANKMLKLKNKKIDYINLKVIVEKILSNLSKRSSKLLILRYVKELHINTICELLNISERSFYRYINKAVNEFSEEMDKLGYNYQKLEIMFFPDEFIKSIFALADDKNHVNNLVGEMSEDALHNYMHKLTISCVW